MGGNGGNGGGTTPLDLRVLVVEDDPVDAELMLDALADDGIVVESRVVQDEQAFLDALRDFAPALVLSDVALPGFSGLRALSLLRAEDNRTPFVFVSGTLSESGAIDALRHGATDYILKSNPARLASAVRRAVAEAAERAARDTAEAELVKAQRFETLAILAGSLGHDLRNTLQPVLIAADLIAVKSDDGETARLCDMIKECCDQGLEMVSAMLALARGNVGQRPGRIRIASLLDAVALLLRPSLPNSVTLSIGAVPPDWEIAGNATELQQCLLNLTLNAVQAMPDGGRLEIGSERLALDDDFFHPEEPRGTGDYIRIGVDDTGHGMDEATLARLFTPFFTTKSAGTGLGLVSCRRLIDNHRGLIRVRSSPGQGTRFDLYLPIGNGHDGVAAGDRGDGLAPGQGEGVLVLSGDEGERRNLLEILDLYGYRPIAAASLADAERVLADGPPLLVALVDRGQLPDLDGGRGVRDRLAAAGYRGPWIEVGSAVSGRAPRANEPALGHLAKPVRAAPLLAALQEAKSDSAGGG